MRDGGGPRPPPSHQDTEVIGILAGTGAAKARRGEGQQRKVQFRRYAGLESISWRREWSPFSARLLKYGMRERLRNLFDYGQGALKCFRPGQAVQYYNTQLHGRVGHEASR